MLSVTKYPRSYVADCRARLDLQLSTYAGLLKAARDGARKAPFEVASNTFEPVFCNSLVLVLDSYFQHRARGAEGKDGNPCNEVRLLARSVLENDGLMLADKQIKMNPETSVLGLEPNDPIRLNAADIGRLADAYFAQIKKTFT